jgi:hypothetical protein
MSNALEQASLIMVPSGYEDGTLGSLKPTDGTGDFTFSRGSDISATRVNADGYIEKGYENLLLQSNSFDTTWVNSNSTETSGQAGYDGTNDAWLLSKSAANGMVYQSISSSGVQTISIYAKKGTNSWMQIYAVGSSNVRSYYDLENGVLGGYALNSIERKIEQVGATDWYRCSVTFNSSLSAVRIFVSDGNNNDTGTSGSIYIQDAMLNQGLVAYPYIETTTAPVAGGILEDMPRLDYSNGSCPALLLEPSRTNLIEYSEYFGGLDTGSVIPIRIPNSAISPEGIQNAYELGNTNSSNARLRSPIISSTTGDDLVISIFAKEKDNSTFGFRHQLSGLFEVVFDLSNQTFTSTGSWTIDAQLKDYGNGWYRCIIYLTATSDYSGTIQMDLSQNDSIYAYGWQVEQDATYPTSYIPTYGVSQTRLVDFASATNVASLIGQNEGSYFIEFQAKRLDEVYSMFSINDGTNNNRIQLTFTDSGTNPRISFFYFVNGVNAFQSTSIQNLVANQTYKFAVTYTQSSLSAYLDGTQIINETGLSLSGGTFNEIAYGLRASSSSFRFNMPVNQTLVFPTALSDEECIALTTI